MDKKKLLEQLEEMFENEEFQKMIDTVLPLPDSEIDDDILCMLAAAYNGTEEYKKAIAVLEGLRERMELSYKWQYRLGYALYHASKDEECEDDEELTRTILERARIAFARCMNLNPPNDWLEDCDYFMDYIEADLRILNGEEPEDDEDEEYEPELYSEEEMIAIEEHIREYFGEFPTILHEIHSPDIHIDVCIVPPNTERNFYTLITMGMGAHIMNIPEELAEEQYGRAELIICLPPDWKLGESDNEWFWPIELLKNLARLPGSCDTWLGFGHTVDNQHSYADTTKMCGAMLIYPADIEEEAWSCELPDGDTVNFFQVLPLYRSEMDYKLNNNAEALLEQMRNISHVVDVKRMNTCLFSDNPAHMLVLDSVHRHANSIKRKNLPVERISAANHLSIYLRWCIENDLMSEEFQFTFPEIIEDVKSGSNTDLREFIIDRLKGKLTFPLFSDKGKEFAEFYYMGDDICYPGDVDGHAEELFGTERYNSEEFQDEAYLFVPFDEQYYNGLKERIEKMYKEFLEQKK